MINYKKAIAYLSKADNLFIQRDDDTYYICNHYLALYVSATTYDAEFRTAKPCFIALQNGERAGRRYDKKSLPTIGEGVDIKAIFKTIDANEDAEFLPIFQNVNISGKEFNLQLAIIGNKQIAFFNPDISSCFDGFCDHVKGKNAKSGILAKSYDEGLYMLPVNMKEETLSIYDRIYNAIHS